MDVDAVLRVMRREIRSGMTEEMALAFARTLLAAAFPWRPVSEDMPRNVAVQIRTSNGAPVWVAAAHDVHGATIVESVAMGAAWQFDEKIVALTVPRQELTRFIELGAEYRMLPE